MTAYYNEHDQFAAGWLRELIADGLIAPGDVDTRSIADVRPIDLIGYDQCHFFAGIGGWSLALRLAGCNDSRPVWTGSCPCQPFSAAGKRKGTADERHLWPEFRRLIAECNPAIAFGEQVASKDGRLWLGGVRADLEALGYAVGAADLCAAGVGAPHIRQRLFWVADADGGIAGDGHLQPGGQHGQQPQDGDAGRLALSDGRQRDGLTDGEGCLADGPTAGRIESDRLAERGGAACGVGDAMCDGAEYVARCGNQSEGTTIGTTGGELSRPGTQSGRAGPSFWSDCDWLPCTDGKARRVEPGTFPLAHGVPARVGRLRAYGNAIVPALAAEFILACRP